MAKKKPAVTTTVIKARRPEPDAPPANEGMWWAQDDEHAGATLWETVRVLEGSQAARRWEDDIYVALYDGRTPMAAGNAATGSRTAGVTLASGMRVTMNLVRSVIDTGASLIAKNKAEVRVLTDGGSQKLQTKAKKLTKFQAGLARACDYHHQKQRCFKDGALTQSGGWLLFVPNHASGKIECERVNPSTITWNDAEGPYPQNLYYRDVFPRSLLLEMYPEAREAIMKAPRAGAGISRQRNSATLRSQGLSQYADMVEVAQGWHLASGETPGRHVVAIEGATLLSEPWKHDFFPLARFTWDDDHDTFAGRPVAKDLAGYQFEINKMVRVISKAQALVCMPRVWVERTAEPNMDKLTNEIGGVQTYTGQPPVIAPASALPPEFYQHLERLYEKAFAEVGVSLLQSQGEKPAGVDSGQALREYNDITSTRHVVIAQRLERFDVQAARIMLALARDLYGGKDAKKTRVLAPGTRFLESIEWSEVDMDEDQYELQSDAVSAMPNHPVGKLQFVQELLKAGLPGIQENALRLLGFPDLEAVTSLETANIDFARRQIEAALEDGKLIAPVPFQDLQGLVTLANKAYIDALNRNVEEDNLEKCRRLITLADDLLRKAKAPADMQMQGVGQPPPPPAPPGDPAMLPPAPMVQDPLSMPAVPTNMPALPPEVPVQ